MFKRFRIPSTVLAAVMAVGALASIHASAPPTTRSFQANEIIRAPDAPSIWDSSTNVIPREYLPHGFSASVEVPPKPIAIRHVQPRASRSRSRLPVKQHARAVQYPYYSRPHEIYYTSNCPAGPSWVMSMARDITTARFGASSWPSQRRLILRESNGNPWCMNSAGAYGVGQALPGSKMGGNWRYDVRHQIEWMCEYEHGRYGNPVNAVAHSDSYGWY